MSLPVIEVVQVVVMVTLILIGYATFIVWGSALDEDLNLNADGMIPMLLQEELPFTPKRLQLLGLSLFLMGVMFLLVWKLPVSLSMPVLILMDGIVLTLGWRLGNAQIRGLILD